MITGFNSDIEHGGKIFHVQTEEKGLDNPVVITLVYCGGEIVTSIEASYADLVGHDPSPEGEVRRRMSDQHQKLIRDILRGKFAPPQMPYGHDLISDRSLDELVLGYLEHEIAERNAKVGRVLNKLERFLTAAEQAQVEPETPAEPVEPSDDTVETVETDSEADVSTPEIDAQVAVPGPESRKRRPVWIWVAAAAVVVGVAGFYAIRSLEQHSSASRVVPSRPAPAIGSNDAATESVTEVQAGVPVVAAPRLQAPESTVEAEPVEVTPSESAETATVAPRIAAAASNPVATPQPQPHPRPEPAQGAALPEAPPEAPQERLTPVQSEPIVPTVVDPPIVPADEVDVSPMARQRDLPRYTRRARRLQQEGIVNLRIHIDSNGEVSDVTLLSGIPDSDLNEAALEATRDWTFSPARMNGQRVAVSKEVAFEFTVRPDRTTSVRIRE